jgi:hypothetical protein
MEASQEGLSSTELGSYFIFFFTRGCVLNADSSVIISITPHPLGLHMGLHWTHLGAETE